MKTLFLILLLLTPLLTFGQAPEEANTVKNHELKITKSEKKEFANYLNDGNWKIAKILNNSCDDEIVADAANVHCLKKRGVSYGSHYSFSANVYYQRFAHVRYATLSLVKDRLIVKNSRQTIQFMVDLGEQDFSEEKLSKEITDLKEFPINDEEILKLRKPEYENTFRDLVITNNLTPQLNHGYLMRSIFLDQYRTLRPARRETLYYFQIARNDKNSLLLLWREIYSQYL